MPHPLDGAFKRVNRANLHIKELESLIASFRKRYEDEIIPQDELTDLQKIQYFFQRKGPGPRLKSQSHNLMGTCVRPIDEVPDDLAIILGEVVYNLRAALDYLIYELSDCKSGTQFPIEDCKLSKDGKYGFDVRAKCYLKWLTPAQIGAIEDLQPYKGCKWSKQLRDISNPDKHRHLTILRSETEDILAFAQDDDTENGGSEAEQAIDLKHSIDVKLGNGIPVIKLLEYLQRSVTGVLVSFEPEFK